MGLFELVAVLLVLTAAFSYVSYRTIGHPTTIGVMIVSLIVSLGIAAMGALGMESARRFAAVLLNRVTFDEALLHGMLSFLLFAGALQIDLEEMRAQKWYIAILATAGVAASIFLVGGLAYVALGWLGIGIPFLHCLLFGALLSPVDPVAVLGILKSAGVPRSLDATIKGEALFNDGIGFVAFLVLLRLIGGSEVPAETLLFFLREAVGGAAFGLAAGFLVYRMLKDVRSHEVEILLTLALAAGGYALADRLHLSGPIAMVVAGIFLGNHGRDFAMSPEAQEHLYAFWDLVDEILNALLFMLIGLEVLVMPFDPRFVAAGALAIGISLFARFATIGAATAALRPFRSFPPGTVRLLTWTGIRGGIAVALALSLPGGRERNAILAMTYMVVAFSIIVQGLTLRGLVKRIRPETPGERR